MMRHVGIGIVSLALLPQLAIAKDDSSQLDTPARRELLRELSSEYATLKVSLPINSKGLMVDDTGEFDWEKHEMSLLRSGQFITAGFQSPDHQDQLRQEEIALRAQRRRQKAEEAYSGADLRGHGNLGDTAGQTLGRLQPQGLLPHHQVR